MRFVFLALLTLIALAPGPVFASGRPYDGDWSLTLSCDDSITGRPALSYRETVRVADGRFSFTRREPRSITTFAGELQGETIRLNGETETTVYISSSFFRNPTSWRLQGRVENRRRLSLEGQRYLDRGQLEKCRAEMVALSAPAAQAPGASTQDNPAALQAPHTAAVNSTASRPYDGDWSLSLSCDPDIRTWLSKDASFQEQVRIVDGRFSFMRREPRWITTFTGELQGTTVRLNGQSETTEPAVGGLSVPTLWRLQGALENPRRFSLEGQRYLTRGQLETCRAEMTALPVASTNTATPSAPPAAPASAERASTATGTGASAARVDPLTSLSLGRGRSLPLPKGDWRLVAKRAASENAGSLGAARTWSTTWYGLRQAQSSWDAYVLRNDEPGSTIALMIAYVGTTSGSWTLPSCRVPANYVARDDYGAASGQRKAQCSGIAQLDRVALAKEFSEFFSHPLDLGGVQDAGTLVASTATVSAGFALITDFHVRLPQGVAADRLVQSLSADSRTDAFRALKEWLARATRSVDLALYENQGQPLRSLAFDVDHRTLAAAGGPPFASPASASTTPSSPAVAAALPAQEQAAAGQRPRPVETQAAAAQTATAAAPTRQETPPAADGLRPGGGPSTQAPATSAATWIPAPRKALVIGNNTYRNVARLQTAKADAQSIERALAGVGYTVTAHYDLTEREMKRAIRNFVRRLSGGDEVAFFYAGHGVQIGGANYLLPIDIGAEDASAVRDEAIPLQRILDDLAEARARFTLAIVDACRDNPFAGTGTGRMIAARGLAPTSAASGQMIMFSAGSGQQALDRVGPSDASPNGLFTRVLLRYMMQKNVPVDRILRQVRAEVVEIANSVGHEQVPALYDQAIGEFYFAR